jgi:hypothetical protein
MALTYEQTFELMRDQAFRGRVTVACAKFASYIADEAPSVPAHPTRYKWSMATLVNPESATVQVIPTVVWDAAVQADGDAVTDVALQTAVETAVSKLI